MKTSGTSWLEVVEVIAKHDPALYRRMHAQALASIEEARQFYVVHCDVSRVPPLESVSDADLPLYLTKNDSPAVDAYYVWIHFEASGTEAGDPGVPGYEYRCI